MRLSQWKGKKWWYRRWDITEAESSRKQKGWDLALLVKVPTRLTGKEGSLGGSATVELAGNMMSRVSWKSALWNFPEIHPLGCRRKLFTPGWTIQNLPRGCCWRCLLMTTMHGRSWMVGRFPVLQELVLEKPGASFRSLARSIPEPGSKNRFPCNDSLVPSSDKAQCLLAKEKYLNGSGAFRSWETINT